MSATGKQELKPAEPRLSPTFTTGAVVRQWENGVWHLEVPAGPEGKYRLAQLDDYESLPRRLFPWQPPVCVKLRARASADEIPGTWGFGFWNNPFGMSILRGVEMLRFPALPNAAWFFIASPANYLSLHDDIPAHGPLAATFRSPTWPGALLALGAPALPLFLFPPAVRLMRRVGQRFVRQDAVRMSHTVTEWHTYTLEWKAQGVRLSVDGENVLESRLAPNGPLGLVLWIDNQYAALPPNGRVSFGTLANPEPVWVDLADIEVLAGERTD